MRKTGRITVPFTVELEDDESRKEVADAIADNLKLDLPAGVEASDKVMIEVAKLPFWYGPDE